MVKAIDRRVSPAGAQTREPVSAKTAPKPESARFVAGQRAVFLCHLTLTANVAESCRVAQVHSSTVYRERQRSETFRKGWEQALAQGYARIEAAVLQFALEQADEHADTAKIATHEKRIRLFLSLLSAHRPSVRGEATRAANGTASNKAAAERFIAKMADMRRRMRGGESDAQQG